MTLSRDDFARAIWRQGGGGHPWRNLAACRGADLEDFFATSDELAGELVGWYCQPCPVRRQCLVEELEVNPKVSGQEGVRGLTVTDRKRLIRRLQAHDLAVWDITDEMIAEHDSHRQLTLETA